MVSGTYGAGFRAILLDLLTFLTSTTFSKEMDTLATYYTNLSCIKFRFEGNPSTEMPSYYRSLYKEEDGARAITEAFSKLLIKTGFETPLWGRLSAFDDVGGKKRYIALGN
jgi:hypothetical protein